MGTFAPGCVIRALNSFAGTFSQFVKFIVPLIIFGLVTPAIADAGRSAGRVLLLTLALAYASTLLAGAFGICLAGAVARRNPLKALWRMLPAYFTGLG